MRNGVEIYKFDVVHLSAITEEVAEVLYSYRTLPAMSWLQLPGRLPRDSLSR